MKRPFDRCYVCEKSDRVMREHRARCDFAGLGCSWPRMADARSSRDWGWFKQPMWLCVRCYGQVLDDETKHSRACEYNATWVARGRPSQGEMERMLDEYIVQERLKGRHALPVSELIHVMETTPMREYVKLYRQADDVAIQTNHTDEGSFVRQVSGALGEAIESQTKEERADALLSLWLPQIVDICAKLRGYKAPLVDEQRVLTAGRITPSDSLVIAASEGNGIAKLPETVEA